GQDGRGHLDLPGRRARLRHDGDAHRRLLGAHDLASVPESAVFPPFGPRALRVLFREPGTAPRTSSRFSSARTATTSMLFVVTRSAPRRPDMRFPLNTRPGYERLPIDPPRPKYSCVPCDAGKPLKRWPFMTPAVPRPLLTPVT